MEHLRTRVMPFTLLGLALVGTGALLSSRSPAPMPVPIDAEPARTHRVVCAVELPELESPPVETVDDEPESAARMPTDAERALAVSTLSTLQRALQQDDGAALSRIAHSTGMIFWSSHAELVPPAAGYTADAIDKPSVRFADSFFPTTYRRDVATKIRTALADLTSEASDAHHTCEERTGAYLTANVVPDPLLASGIVTDHPSFDGNLDRDDYAAPLRLRAHGLEVFLGIENGAARLTHIVEFDPCDTIDQLPEAP